MSCLPWIPPSPLKLKLVSHSYHPKKPRNPTSSVSISISISISICCSSSSISSSSSSRSSLPRLILHDTLDAVGIDTRHARDAREGFRHQVGRLRMIDGQTSIAISGGADLAKTALHIAAEDDSLISHSSVPLPVDAFVDRLDDLSMGFCSLYMPPSRSPPEVLTCRAGSTVMLSLIYSEMLKMLRMCGFLDFDVEIYFPDGSVGLPRGYHKLKSTESDQLHILTSRSLLVLILRNLKTTFWPFQYDHSSSLFLRAAHAANHIHGPSIVGEKHSESYSSASGLDIASTKAAQHRLGRGVWTNVRFGDMQRALAASERLIILTNDPHELRDYAVLLYHCGYYEECLQNLKLYQSSKISLQLGDLAQKRSRLNPLDVLEEDAVEKLVARVNLILAEEGWSGITSRKSYWVRNQEPW